MIFFFKRWFGGLLSLITQILVCGIWGLFAYTLLKQIREHYQHGGDGAVTVVAAFMVAWEVAGLLGTAFWLWRQFAHAEANRRLTAFLQTNADKLRNNEKVFYRCKVITLKTVLVRHHLVCSAVVFTGRTSTRWLVKGQEPRLRHALGASLYCFWNGWWGFPFGLIWTPMALVRNMAGETTILVEELISAPPPPFVGAGQRVAHRVKDDLLELLFVK